jgi:DNA-binding MarR family transcriptional regulator
VLARLERQGMILRTVDRTDRRRARFRLTAAGRKVDRERKGTVEAAVRRAMARADPTMMAHTAAMLALVVEQLIDGD